jgi:uncharacterized protein
MIVADTGALIALFDRSDRHHDAVRRLYEENPDRWLLPWAILPEVDYLTATHLGQRAQDLWLADLSSGAFNVEWGRPEDLAAAERLCRRYKGLRIGLVDAVVIAVAERLRAAAIATLDLKHFGAVTIKGRPLLLPRDA